MVDTQLSHLLCRSVLYLSGAQGACGGGNGGGARWGGGWDGGGDGGWDVGFDGGKGGSGDGDGCDGGVVGECFDGLFTELPLEVGRLLKQPSSQEP